jgi:kinetochore protein NNF1
MSMAKRSQCYLRIRERGASARAPLGASSLFTICALPSIPTHHTLYVSILQEAMSSNIHPPSRSPSPPPDAPIAEAPGPRATGLQRMFDTTVKATLAKCSSTGFASCFPTPAKACPEQLEHIRTQLVEQLDRTWRANFDKIMKDREVVKSLNSLDQCITDAKSRKTRAEESANGGSVEIPTA